MKYKARLKVLSFFFLLSLIFLPLSQIQAAATDATPADSSTPSVSAPASDSSSSQPAVSADAPSSAQSDSTDQPTSTAPDASTNPDQVQTAPAPSTATKPAPGPTPASATQQSSSKDYIDKAIGIKLPTVNNSAGAFIYDYPITVPPGRNGLQPDLNISYNNQQADSHYELGYGWYLNIPYIETLNKKGVNSMYTDGNYYSSLSGELVSTGPTSFKARTEDGSFLTYSLSSSTWTVTDKQGTTYKFGLTAGSRQDDPNNANDVFRWYLEETRDKNNNYIKYQYFKDAGEIYPASILYTGNGTTDGIFEIDFLRQTRADVIQNFKPSFSVTDNYIINEIDAKISGTWTRRYALGYSAGDNGTRSLLLSITETGWDTNNSATTLPATNFSYQFTSDPSTKWVLNSFYTLPNVSLSNCIIADVNGDGLPDILESWAGIGQSAQNAYINNGHGGWTLNASYAPPVTFFNTANGFPADQGVRLIDVNGDGLPDMIQSANASGSWNNAVYLNSGTGWTLTTTTFQPPVIFADTLSNLDTTARFLDLNGDGLPDIITNTYHPSFSGMSNTQGVYLNNGSGWVTSTLWTVPVTNLGFAEIADVNGDGLSDILESYTDQNSVTHRNAYINSGTGWTLNANYQPPIDFFSQIFGTPTDVGVRLLDLNGDGLSDIIQSAYTGQAPTQTAYLNTGKGWALSSAYTSPIFFADVTSNHSSLSNGFGDDNDDGMTDLWQTHSPYGSPLPGVYFHQKMKADLLTQVTYNKGGSTQITYQASTQYKDSSSNLLSPNLPLELDTVQSLTTNDGSGNTVSKTYSYANGKYYFNGPFDRKFSAFGQVTETDSQGNVTKNYFHGGFLTYPSQGEYSDNFFKIGKQYRKEAYNSTNSLFYKEITKWDFADLGSGSGFVQAIQNVKSSYDGQASHLDKAEAYAYSSTNGNLSQKIEYGQVTGSDDGTFVDSGTDQFTTTYAYASGGTVIGLPDDITVTNQSSAKVKETKYFYDGSTTLGSVTKGNLTEQDDWKSSTSYITHKKSYDPTYGLVTQDLDPNNNATNYGYDSFNLYPITVTNALNQATHFTYDYSSGQTVQTTDVNGFAFINSYDGFDRLTLVQQPDLITPTTLVTKSSYAYTDTQNGVSVAQSDYMDAANAVSTYSYFDGLGRIIQQRKSAEDSGSFNVKDFSYNSLGLLAKESLPYVSGGGSKTSATTTTALYINYAYDALSRITSISNAVGTTSNSYTPWQVSITDQNSHTKDLIKDAYDNLVQVNEHYGASTYITTYAYDYLKDLTKITDANTNIRNFTYDGLGRRLSAQDLHPSSSATFGTWTFGYDNAGNPTQKIDPNGNTINYTYDVLNRPALEKLATVTKVTYGYDTCTDGVGRLCSVTTPALTTNDAYNALGLIATETKNINSSNYETDSTYNRLGQQLSIVNPDSSQVIYTYNLAGLPETVLRKETTDASAKYVVTNFDYSPLGDPSSITLANGAVTTNTYDSSKLYRLAQKITTLSAANLQDISYTYDPVGNITAITDNSATNTKKNITYGYDPLNRLTSYSVTSAVNGNNHSETYTYDPVGNITNKSDLGNYTYGGTGLPNPDAVTSDGTNTYAYDNNGNMLTKSTGSGSSTIAVDATTTSITNAFNSGPTTRTWTHTTSSGSNRLLVLTADLWQDVGGTGTISSASYNGIALTKATANRKTNMNSEVWYLVNPPSGAHTMSVTVTGATDSIKLASSTFTGADQTAPYVASTTAVGTTGNPTISRTTTSVNSLLVATLSRFSTTAATTNRTSSYNNATGSTLGGSSFQVTTATGSYSDTYTGSSANDWAMIMSEFKPASSGVTTTNVWDYNNRLTNTTNGTFNDTYTYDQNGERLSVGSGSSTTIYPTKGYNTNGTTTTKHIFANGQLIADITGSGASALTQYVNTDQLTGSNVITNDSGATKEVLDYYPFGALRLDEQTGFNEQRKFAGHEFDADTGLSYQDARYYNPSIGRFVSEDSAFLSLGLNLADPQSLNAYTYTRNNPVINIDPAGNTLQQTVGTFFLDLAVPNEQAQIALGNATQNAYNNNVVVRTALDHPFVAGAVIGVTSAGLSYGALTAAPYAADVISTISPSTIGRAVTGASLNVAGKYLEAKAGHENVSAADYAYTAFVGAVAANARATLITRVFTAAATDLVGQRFLHPTDIDPKTTALSAATTFGVGEITRLSLFSAAPEFSKFVTEQALSFVFDAAGHVLNAGITNSAKQKGKTAK